MLEKPPQNNHVFNGLLIKIYDTPEYKSDRFLFLEKERIIMEDKEIKKKKKWYKFW
jgi:hypothetical protein